MILSADFSCVQLKLRQTDGKPFVFDPIRKKWVVLTPEEHVRQRVLLYLVEQMHYPASLISVEKAIVSGNMPKRFDIVVYDKNHKPWLLAECKSPEIIVSERTLYQLLSYQRVMQCNYWLLTNGHQTFCADACDVNDIKWLASLPAYNT